MWNNLRNLIIAVVLALVSVAAFAAPVDINKANATEISEAMKGVGTEKAKAIIDFRNEHGSFKSIDELVLVKGIAEKTIEKNRDNIYVSQDK